MPSTLIELKIYSILQLITALFVIFYYEKYHNM